MFKFTVHSLKLFQNKYCDHGAHLEGRIVKGEHRQVYVCSDPCFPGIAKAMLQSGKSVMMSELKTGDQVQTGNTLII